MRVSTPIRTSSLCQVVGGYVVPPSERCAFRKTVSPGGAGVNLEFVLQSVCIFSTDILLGSSVSSLRLSGPLLSLEKMDTSAMIAAEIFHASARPTSTPAYHERLKLQLCEHSPTYSHLKWQTIKVRLRFNQVYCGTSLSDPRRRVHPRLPSFRS